MSQQKLDLEWVTAYLDRQEEELQSRLSPEQARKVMNKLREFTLSIMYKQARRHIVRLKSGRETDEAEEFRAQNTRL